MNLEQLTTSRRGFLRGMGGLVVAVSLPLPNWPRPVLAAGGFPPTAPPSPDQVSSWLAIARDGTVTVFTGKVELGTGVATATMQIVAEELDVPLSAIKLVQGVTGKTVDQGYTAGSQSMRTQWARGVRQAAASAREALLQLAAARLGTTPDRLAVTAGVVHLQDQPGRKVSYGALVGGKPIAAKVAARPRLKDPGTFTVVGKSVRREDIPAKVFGTFTYVQDVKVPGMLHGRVVRPVRPSPLVSTPTPRAQVIQGTIANATLQAVDESSVRHLPGFVQLVTRHDFVGVVARREEQAIAAAQALRVSWTDKAALPDQQSLYEAITSAHVDNTKVLSVVGDVDAALASAARVMKATYAHPYQIHGSIGPSCAVADVRDGQATVWSGTQGVYQLRNALATLLGLPADNVRVVYVEGSGCYGLNGADDVSLSAALLSQAVGRPVRVQHMRADEMSWENFGTPMVIQLEAGLDASGRIVGWSYQGWTANRGNRPGPPGNLPAGVLAGFPEPPPPPSPPSWPPLGDDSLNSMPSYAFPNQKVVSYGVYQPWLFTGPLRSPSRLQNTFANESFMDELAAAAGADPVDFRLRHTGDPRLATVIRRAAEAAGWRTRPSPAGGQGGNRRRGRGIAAVHYEGTSSYVAAVITATVDTGSGAITVDQVAVAHDCGVIINPDGLRNQIEGNIVQGLSRALKEEVRFDRSGVLSVDWSSYPIITFPELPDDVRIELIDHPGLPALGAGEASISVIAGALGNAVFDATGARLRQVPFTPDRVKAALSTV
ncbi:MAG TPA: molybdopterin cofactor-binding domain-containing protein [Candidatus Dormibacteraeota bacterium]|nr:molybdopterin cofactor-binding domain-containing protein [Candidatus Dormibacteraeota bacterium]